MTRTSLILATAAAALAWIGLTGPAARGALVASDTFETYGSGSQLNGQNGGTGFTGPYVVDSGFLTSVTAATQSLTYAAGAVNSNGGSIAAQFVNASNSNQLISRPFVTQGGTVYFSFLYRTNNPTTSEDFVQIGLSDVATGEPKISVGTATNTAGNAPPATFFARVPTGTAGSTGSGITLMPDTTYFLVAKASMAGGSSTYNMIDLYVNPTTGTEPASPSATTTATAGSGAASVSNFIVRTARLDTGDQYLIDNLAIGTTYADVVPVPEPAAAAGLLGAGALALLRRWRVRSR